MEMTGKLIARTFGTIFGWGLMVSSTLVAILVSLVAYSLSGFARSEEDFRNLGLAWLLLIFMCLGFGIGGSELKKWVRRNKS